MSIYFTKSLHGMMQGVGTIRGKERGRRPTRRKSKDMRDAMAEAKASDLHHLACADIILSFIELEHKNLMRELNHQDLWGSSQNFKLLILMYGHMGTSQ